MVSKPLQVINQGRGGSAYSSYMVFSQEEEETVRLTRTKNVHKRRWQRIQRHWMISPTELITQTMGEALVWEAILWKVVMILIVQ